MSSHIPLNVQIPTGNALRLRFYVDHRLPAWFAKELCDCIGDSDQPGRALAGGWIRRKNEGHYLVDLQFIATHTRPDSQQLRDLLTPLLALPLLDVGEICGRLKAEDKDDTRLLAELTEPPEIATGTILEPRRRHQ